MYYKARSLALNNEMPFHVVAILYRGKSIVQMGSNTPKTHPHFKRSYKSGECSYHMHAEQNVLRFSKPGDRLRVLRFSAKGQLTMAKPCPVCQKFIKQFGIRGVEYSDWEGNIIEMKEDEK